MKIELPSFEYETHSFLELKKRSCHQDGVYRVRIHNLSRWRFTHIFFLIYDNLFAHNIVNNKNQLISTVLDILGGSHTITQDKVVLNLKACQLFSIMVSLHLSSTSNVIIAIFVFSARKVPESG